MEESQERTGEALDVREAVSTPAAQVKEEAVAAHRHPALDPAQGHRPPRKTNPPGSIRLTFEGRPVPDATLACADYSEILPLEFKLRAVASPRTHDIKTDDEGLAVLPSFQHVALLTGEIGEKRVTRVVHREELETHRPLEVLMHEHDDFVVQLEKRGITLQAEGVPVTLGWGVHYRGQDCWLDILTRRTDDLGRARFPLSRQGLLSTPGIEGLSLRAMGASLPGHGFSTIDHRELRAIEPLECGHLRALKISLRAPKSLRRVHPSLGKARCDVRFFAGSHMAESMTTTLDDCFTVLVGENPELAVISARCPVHGLTGRLEPDSSLLSSGVAVLQLRVMGFTLSALALDETGKPLRHSPPLVCEWSFKKMARPRGSTSTVHRSFTGGTDESGRFWILWRKPGLPFDRIDPIRVGIVSGDGISAFATGACPSGSSAASHHVTLRFERSTRFLSGRILGPTTEVGVVTLSLLRREVVTTYPHLWWAHLRSFPVGRDGHFAFRGDPESWRDYSGTVRPRHLRIDVPGRDPELHPVNQDSSPLAIELR